MEITGQVFKQLPLVEGENEKGTWCKARVVVTYGEDMDKKALLTTRSRTLADRLKLLDPNKRYVFGFSIEAWEYEGNWYNEMRLLRILEIARTQPQGQ